VASAVACTQKALVRRWRCIRCGNTARGLAEFRLPDLVDDLEFDFDLEDRRLRSEINPGLVLGDKRILTRQVSLSSF
jgi:hypothetical protein